MRINEQIRIPQVRLFDDTTDEALGIVPIEQARQLAVDRGLDLVEVAPLAQPPVCRLMDYGRFKFEALKREKDSRRDHNVVQLKEQKLRPKISDNDFRTKLNKVKQFLGEGDKVKLTIMFRGREMVHQEYGRKLLDRMTQELSDMAVIERSPLVEGRNMIMILSPTAKKHPRHDERTHDERARADAGSAGNGSAQAAPRASATTAVHDDAGAAAAPAAKAASTTTAPAAPAPATAEAPAAAAPATAAPVAEAPAKAAPAAAAPPGTATARKPAAPKKTTTGASTATKKIADSKGKQNAQDSNA